MIAEKLAVTTEARAKGRTASRIGLPEKLGAALACVILLAGCAWLMIRSDAAARIALGAEAVTA